MPTIDELRAEHVRLVTQARVIEESRQSGAHMIDFDGVAYFHDRADELTRAAIYEVELKLEAAGVYG